MKLIVDKHEYAQIIRNCHEAISGYACGRCALKDCCNGESDLENMATVIDEETEVELEKPML